MLSWAVTFFDHRSDRRRIGFRGSPVPLPTDRVDSFCGFLNPGGRGFYYGTPPSSLMASRDLDLKIDRGVR
jgi:hypothetical protein